MKQKVKHLRRVFAGLLCLCVLFGLLAPLASAQDTQTVYIKSTSDWRQLVQNCRLDTWSQGKTVILDCDLDLAGEEGVPTFGGTFDGGGHTIRGLTLMGDGSRRGLFRYLQEGATVKDLNVAVVLTVTGDWTTFGGIAGVNRGTITRCTVSGILDGTERVGGIAGINEATGQIINCTVSGTVSGEHYTGGIAGENYGSILQCTNKARVNTKVENRSLDLDQIDWSHWNSTENLPADTDTGGVAGWSKGVIQGCVNHGDVGYPHIGYNVGGIVGRQAGYVEDCINRGTIQGRKEVGGIVGQMEPYTRLRFEEDTLQKLTDALDVLQNWLRGTLDDLDGSRQGISDRVTAVGDLTESARTDASGLLDQVEELGEGTIDTVNDLSARVSRVLDQALPVSKNMEEAGESLGDALNRLDEAVEDLERSAGHGKDGVAEVKTAAKEVRKALSAVRQAAREVCDALISLRDSVGMEEEFAAAKEELDLALAGLGAAIPDGEKGIKRLTDHLREAGDQWGTAGDLLLDSAESLRDSLECMTEASDTMTDAMSGLSDIVEEQVEEPELELPKLDSSFHQQEDSLSATLDALSDELHALRTTADETGDTLSANLRGVGDQFDAILDLLRDAGEDGETDRIVDVSGEESTVTMGTVAGCLNNGTVEGDINIGGVAGSMALEFDFDPEDDVIRQGETSAKFQYLTHAVLRDSVNRGTVTGRKDGVGSVIGRAELGLVTGCQGYGSAESTNGSYVGGVVGIAHTPIRDSWAKCALSGGSYVGGIAGSAEDLSGCRSLVEITEASACMGAIAGEADGTLTQNYFVSETLGGVDGVSYAGQAEPVDYDSLLSMDAPGDFASFMLTFVAGDEMVKQLCVHYGQSLVESELPAVPEREGFYGAWEEFDRTCLRFDRTVEAVYTPWTTTLSGGEGAVLAEGRFAPGEALAVSAAQEQPPETDGEVLGLWQVETKDGTPFTALRVRRPEKAKNLSLWCLTQQGAWEKLACTQEGSYLRTELETDRAVVCLVEGEGFPILWMGAVCACAGTALLVLLWRRKRRDSGRSDPKQQVPVE